MYRVCSPLRLVVLCGLLFTRASGPAAAVWPPPAGPGQWQEPGQRAPEPEIRPDALVFKLRDLSGVAGGVGFVPPDLLAGLPVEEVTPLFAWPGKTSSRRPERPPGVFRVTFRGPVDLAAVRRRMALRPDVEYAEPVLRARVTATTSDPYLASSGAWGQAYQDLWGLHKIAAPAAWDLATGQGVVVAVIDTGSDLGHPDLAASLWHNPGEIAGNGADDDGNGFVDDALGWDFAHGDADPSDDYGHGTHVAGTLAAVGDNGSGVVGVAWGAKVMTVKGLDENGAGDSDRLAEAIVYAAENGARVINMSWRMIGFSQVVEDALAAAYGQGVVLVASAGNDFTEAWRVHPASSRYVLCIGASTPTDLRAQFSNAGGSLDVLAPGGAESGDNGGGNILSLRSSLLSAAFPSSLWVGSGYLRLDGTSMAAPHVAGLAALLLEAQPGLTPEEVRQAIRRSAADILAAGWDLESGYGRIAAAAALGGLTVRGSARLLSPRAHDVFSGLVLEVQGTTAAPGFSSYTLESGTGASPSAWTLVTSSTTPVTGGPLASWDTSALSDGTYTLRLTVLDTSGHRFEDRLEVVVDRVRFTGPAAGSIRRGGELIPLTGWSQAPDFSHYILEYQDPDTGTWKTAGMTLSGGGQAPAEGGVLGTWDTSGLTRADYYRVRLTVFRQDGLSDTAELTLLIDPFLHPGWPRTLPNFSEGFLTLTFLDDVTAADIDGDGTRELLFAQGDQVHVLRHDGTYLAGWPQPLPSPLIAQGSPAVGDLDGDGKPELVVVTTSYEVFVFHSDGTRTGPLSQRGSSVALGDVLGDSRPELIVCGADGSVWVLGAGGTALAPPYAGTLRFPSPPVLTDLDGDGKLDIVVAETDQTLALHAFRGDGTPLTGFPVSLGAPSVWYGRFYPAAADLDADGWPEIVAGNPQCQMFAVSRTGKVLPGWPFEPAEAFEDCGPVTLSDLDGDGRAEVVAGARSTESAESATLFVLNGQGQVLPGWPLRWTGSSAFYGAGAAALADIDGDGARELVADGDADFSRPFALRGFERNGSAVPGFPRPTADIGASVTNTPAVLDLDADGLLELAWVNFRGQVFVWDLDAPARITALDWPMFRHDPGHTAAVPASSCSPASQGLDFFTVAPCRVLDTRGQPGPNGGPALGSGVPRLLPVAGRCGIPPTARAVAVNVTVTGPTAAGHLGFAVGGCPVPPGTSTINFSAGQTRANLAILPLATNGTGAITVFPTVLAAGNVHLILDVTGYFE
jgi:subtilisin family serine protease